MQRPSPTGTPLGFFVFWCLCGYFLGKHGTAFQSGNACTGWSGSLFIALHEADVAPEPF